MRSLSGGHHLFGEEIQATARVAIRADYSDIQYIAGCADAAQLRGVSG